MIQLNFESELELRQFIRDNMPKKVKGVNCNTPEVSVFSCQHVYEKTVKRLAEAFLNYYRK